MKKLKIAIIGLGGRGCFFAECALKHKQVELVAVADLNISKLKKAHKEYGLSENDCYNSADEFFARGKIADAVFVCTQDRQHREHSIKAMQLGYDVCLEKPIATTEEDCNAIYAVQLQTNRKVMVCHVLRYSLFYAKLKEIIESGEIGDVVNISQTENVGYWHNAHSYVRGPWRNSEQSSPMILAKCCHDLDILFWLLATPCKSVSSYGDLYYFTRKNAPVGFAAHCIDCAPIVRARCPYDCFKIYKDIYKAYNNPIVGNSTEFCGDMSHIDAILSDKSNPYSRCVFACDNNVVDHQVVNMLFEGNITAQLTMTAFSKECHRNIKIHGTLGEIVGDMENNIVQVLPFRADNYTVDLTQSNEDLSVHGGGDKLLFDDFVAYLQDGAPSATRTTLQDSLLSHKMCFAAEYSRCNGGIPIKIE